jgi:pimeloyl-ACP methyl ester carboxylesterase
VTGAPVTFTSTILDVRGRAVDLRRAGIGAPLLYLHAVGGDQEGLPALDDLARDHTVLMPMHPGFGRSEGIEAIDSIEDVAFHYLAVLEALDLGAVDVIGSSYGGWVALELACRWPERVRRMVLADPAGLWLDEAPMAELFGAEPGELAARLYHDQTLPHAQMLRALTALGDLPEEILLPLAQAVAAVARVAWNPYFHNPKLPERLHRVRVPVLLVWGRQDGLIPLAHGERYRTLLPEARLELIDRCGHLPIVERPDDFLGLVRPFLAGGAAGPSPV